MREQNPMAGVVRCLGCEIGLDAPKVGAVGLARFFGAFLVAGVADERWQCDPTSKNQIARTIVGGSVSGILDNCPKLQRDNRGSF
jgi:hypothetical protein